MSVLTHPTGPSPLAPPPIPALRNGDRLTAEEFERRYDAMPDLKKAELINGVVYMPSPVGFEEHAEPHFDFITFLGIYRLATPGVRGADNATLRLPLANRPQPDAALLIRPTHGGQVQIESQRYIVGGPELVAEIAATSANYDLHDKLELYRQNNILEYIVWRVLDQALDWFVLRNGVYVPLTPSAAGVFHSTVFPGLWIDAAALLRNDLVRVNQVLQQGIASPEHAAFVARLQQHASHSSHTP